MNARAIAEVLKEEGATQQGTSRNKTLQTKHIETQKDRNSSRCSEKDYLRVQDERIDAIHRHVEKKTKPAMRCWIPTMSYKPIRLSLTFLHVRWPTPGGATCEAYERRYDPHLSTASNCRYPYPGANQSTQSPYCPGNLREAFVHSDQGHGDEEVATREMGACGTRWS